MGAVWEGTLELRSEGGEHAGSGDGGCGCVCVRVKGAREGLLSKGGGQKRLAGQWSPIGHGILQLAPLDSHVPEIEPC